MTSRIEELSMIIMNATRNLQHYQRRMLKEIIIIGNALNEAKELIADDQGISWRAWLKKIKTDPRNAERYRYIARGVEKYNIPPDDFDNATIKTMEAYISKREQMEKAGVAIMPSLEPEILEHEIKSVTFTVPYDLHIRIKAECAVRNITQQNLLREVAEERWPDSSSPPKKEVA